jgi:hypothetical protein
LLRTKTEQLQALVKDDFATYQKAAEIALAEPGTALYNEAMNETRHDDFGVYPCFARAPVNAIASTFNDEDAKYVLQAMEVMWEKVQSNTLGKKKPKDFKKRFLMEGDPDHETFLIAWFLDSYRLVSTGARMNVVRGEPKYMEQQMGVKFALLEWLEIFGVQCARQRMMSVKGFDLAGLCVRLHCFPPVSTSPTWRLVVTIFLPGGPDKTGKDGKPIFDWLKRMHLAQESWREVRGMLFTQAKVCGAPNEGLESFPSREVIFCPGFTFEGIKQAGGLPTEAPPAASEQPTRYDPVLNPHTPPKWPSPGAALLQRGPRFIGSIQPTIITFHRRRQFSWAASSLTKKSHDFSDGMIALCLAFVDPETWKENDPEIVDAKRVLALQNDDVKSLRFGSTIPMTMDKKGKAIGFPHFGVHPQLERIEMAYAATTRNANGGQAAEAKMPATAVLILSDELGFKSQIQARNKGRVKNFVQFYVDIKSEDVKQLADELWEQLLLLAMGKHGPNWQGRPEDIDRDAKENKEVLRHVFYQLENLSTGAISGKISKINW